MIKTAKVVGLNSDKEAAQALVFEDTLFVVVECAGDDAFSRTRVPLLEVEELFSQAAGQEMSVRLAQAFEAIEKSLVDTTSHQVLVGALQENDKGAILYLMHQGEELGAHLFRGGKHTELLHITGQKQVVSGFLEAGDRVVLTTNSLGELLGEDFYKLESFEMENVAEIVGGYFPEGEINPIASIIISKEDATAETDSTDSGDVVIPLKEGIQLADLRSKPNLRRRGDDIRKMKQLLFNKRFLALLLILLGMTGVVFAGVKLFKHFKPSRQPVTQTSPASPTPLAIVYQVPELALWLDLDLVKKDFISEQLSWSAGKILLLDKKQKTLIVLNTATKASDLLAGKADLGEGIFASLNGDKAAVFSLDKGILVTDLHSKDTKSAVKLDTDWGRIGDLYAFAGNLYLLDASKNRVYKYLPIVGGYADKRDYFSDSTKVDLSDALRLQIDSSLWVLSSGGKLSKFTQGNADFFSYSELDKPVNNPKSFFVSSETDNLYLLDSGNSRVLVLDKKGKFFSAYENPRLKDFSDLVVEEAGKKVYLLEGSKIYSMDLK